MEKQPTQKLTREEEESWQIFEQVLRKHEKTKLSPIASPRRSRSRSRSRDRPAALCRQPIVERQRPQVKVEARINPKIKEQVEFYLSDQNLVKDIYFQKIIREAGKDGWFELQHIMQCNVIKRLNATAEEVILALKDSKSVEVSGQKSMIRRFGGAPIPELQSSASGFQKYSFKPTYTDLQRSFNKRRDF